MLDTGFMTCERDVLNGHVFEVSRVVLMLVSCDVVTSFGWLSTFEDDRECVNRHDAMSKNGVLEEIHRR
jgi:hypothetical protein